jgi:phosphoglycerate kinase
VVLLQNLRFHPGEKKNDETFVKELAKLGEVYVNDAFGAAHRAHASVFGLPKVMRERGAGLLLESELQALGRLRTDPPRPFVAVLGGAKVSDKIGVIEALMMKVDTLIIGGAMANTFLAAQGHAMGKSLLEEDKLALARSILAKAEERNVNLLLPTDLSVAESIEADAGTVRAPGELGEAEMALDVGPASVETFAEACRSAAAIFWNGPLGLFENDAFSAGTRQMAKVISDCRGFSVVGGGDSVAAVNEAGLADAFDHVSTGGGASLELLEGKKLPGVEALR